MLHRCHVNRLHTLFLSHVYTSVVFSFSTPKRAHANEFNTKKTARTHFSLHFNMTCHKGANTHKGESQLLTLETKRASSSGSQRTRVECKLPYSVLSELYPIAPDITLLGTPAVTHALTYLPVPWKSFMQRR